MADADSTSVGGTGEEQISTQLPSYEEQRKIHGHTLLTEDARRIRWLLNGPLTTAVSVMQHHQIDPDDAVFESYYRTLEGGEPSWHPISQSPYTTPKVSSITTWVDPLDEWLGYWLERHEKSVIEGDFDPAKARFGPLPETGYSSYEKETGRYLEACCGTERPVNKGTKLLVKATGDFLTIHDFLSVVHPYLMARRGDIVATMREEQYRTTPVPAETELFVSLTYSNPHFLLVSDEAEWLKEHEKPGRRIVQDPATQARMELYAPHFQVARLRLAKRRAAERRAAEVQAAEQHSSNTTDS